MKNFLILIQFLLLSIIPILGKTQTDTNFFKLADLTFKNKNEESVFSSFNEKRDAATIFDLLFTSYDKSKVGDKAGALQKINTCVSYLQTQIADKSEVKKVKITYEYVHKQFLKVYKLKNSFIDVFETGEYNCVSASALYAIIFSKLAIPFQIKETPQHVYLIAYPNSSKILIETTAPSNGYYQFTGNFVTKFVANLYASKIISKEEYETIPANDLFNKHYFTSESISLTHLAASQYSNYAIYFLEDVDFKNATEEIKKAYFIYPDQRGKYILESTLSVMLDKSGYEDLESVSNLAVLCKFNNMKSAEISNEVIMREFSKIMETQLIKNSDYEKFDKSYLKISEVLTDTLLKKEIGFAYHYELARLGYVSSKPQDYVVGHLEEAYKLNPMNANLRAITGAIFEKSIQRFDDSKSVMELADIFSKKFDFMKTSDYYLDLKSRCMLDLAYQNFFFNDMVKGEKFLKEFELFMKENQTVPVITKLVERAYGQAAGEYYKKGNHAKAKQMIKTGLIYAPNSFGLQQRLNQLSN
jgi:tetratricopeptide (TPR) repeat protein